MSDSNVLVRYKVDNQNAIKKVNEFNETVAQTPAVAEEADHKLQKFGQAAARIGKVLAVASATAFTVGLAEMGRRAIRTGAEFETLEVTLRTITGSAEEASQAMAWILDFAKTTPYQINEITRSFIRLKATGLDPTDGTLRVLGDTIAAFAGGSQEVMGRVTTAIAQIVAKGKLEGQELRQLAEANIPVYQILNAELGMTREEMAKLGSGGISAGEGLKAILTGLDKMVGGAMQEQMKTFNGMVSNLGDQITMVYFQLSQRGVLDAAKEGLAAIMDSMKQSVDDGTIETLAIHMGKLFKTIAEAMPTILGWVRKLLALFAQLVEGVSKYSAHIAIATKLIVGFLVIKKVTRFALAIGKLIWALGLLQTAVQGVAGYFTGLIAQQAILSKTGTAMAGTLGKVGKGAAQAGVGFLKMTNAITLAAGAMAAAYAATLLLKQWFDSMNQEHLQKDGIGSAGYLNRVTEHAKVLANAYKDIGNWTAEQTEREFKWLENVYAKVQAGKELTAMDKQRWDRWQEAIPAYEAWLDKELEKKQAINKENAEEANFLASLDQFMAGLGGAAASGKSALDVYIEALDNVIALHDQVAKWADEEAQQAFDAMKYQVEELQGALLPLMAEYALGRMNIFEFLAKSSEVEGDKMQENWRASLDDMNVDLEAALEQGQKIIEDLDLVVEPKVTEDFQRDMERTFDAVQMTFDTMLSSGFEGKLDSFADLWDDIWSDLAKSMTKHLSDAFKEGFKEKGSIFEGITAGWQNIVETIKENPEMAILTGVGGAIASGQGSGGWGGALQGAMSGAMAGMGITAALTEAGIIGSMFGPIGVAITAILAVAAAIMGFLGGGTVTPETAGMITFDAASGYITRHRDQYVDTGIEQAWIQDRIEEYRVGFAAMNDILRIFGDASLFELLGDPGTIEFGGRGDLNMWATIFREEIIPEALRDVFEIAIRKGLSDVGVSGAAINQLWKELDIMGMERMVEHLERYVLAVVGMNDLLEALDFDAMLEEAGRNSMETFQALIQGTLDNIELLTIGMEDMTLLERAETALEIESLVLSVRQAEIQMLQQLQQMQDQMNASVDRQLESILTGGMDDVTKENYYIDQINAIMADIADGVESPEELAQLMADLGRYSSLLQGVMGDRFYDLEGPDGRSWADYITDALTWAQDEANILFETFRDEIREANDDIIAELESIYDLLTTWNETMTDDPDDGDDLDPGDRNDDPEDYLNLKSTVVVDSTVTVTPSAYFESYVKSVVNAAIEEVVLDGRGPE